MPSPYSPYILYEGSGPHFQPGELPAASAFVGMTLLLVVEVNVEMFRMFKRRQGAYQPLQVPLHDLPDAWKRPLLLVHKHGLLGLRHSAMGIIPKSLTPSTGYIWVFYYLLTSLVIPIHNLPSSRPTSNTTIKTPSQFEFAVLNQLMAIGARGLRGESDIFAGKRYNGPTTASLDAFLGLPHLNLSLSS
ncbi:MAG: hypothetical protein Q9170_001619 [Blastenia crenularia]